MPLERLLRRRGLEPDRWSIALKPDEEPATTWHPDRLLKTASVAKVFLLVELARQIEAGTISPQQRLSRRRVAAVGDSGLWQHLTIDALPIEDVAVLVGAVSDNWASNALLDLVGMQSVDAVAAALAPGGSRLMDRVRDRRSSEHPETLSVGCASDWVAILSSLSSGNVYGPAVSQRVLAWLAPAVDLSMVASAFHLDPLSHDLPDRGVAIWSKTGTDEGVRADVGRIEGPRQSVSYAVICNWDPALADFRDDVLEAMRDIGSLVRSMVW